jgi:hypothetical protein
VFKFKQYKLSVYVSIELLRVNWKTGFVLEPEDEPDAVALGRGRHVARELDGTALDGGDAVVRN